MTHHWRLRTTDPERAGALGRDVGVHPLVGQLLLNRGITNPAEAARYLEARRDSFHDPELLAGASRAAERIVAAVRADRKIVIYGDYDVDGVCGTSVLWACLKLAGARNVSYYIPSRIDEGYGLNAEALRKLAADGAELIVTVDCGVTAVEEARLARALGVELIVTDHHTPGPVFPEASVVVHPRHPDGDYPFAELCGCGVAFKLAWQICKSFGDGKKASPHLRDFLVQSINLVALATIADVVPLEDENRVFVRHGLHGLAKSPTPGLRALLEVANIAGRDRISTGQVGFGLAPRINAAGRLRGAMQAVELLTTTDPERAAQLAQELDACNRERQEIERRTVEEARAIIDATGPTADRGALVVGREGWHPGVIGIVAGRLAEWYHRPAIVVSLQGDLGQGSARSVPGFDLFSALSACRDRLITFGGHRAAAGLKVAAEQFPAFAREFDAHCRSTLTAEQKRRELVIDAEVMLGELTTRLIESINRLEPYGIGNPRPLLVAERVRIQGAPRVMGEKQNHLRFRLRQGPVTVSAIGWNLAARAAELREGALCSVVFCPEINEWNGAREVRMEIRDFQVHGEGAAGEGSERSVVAPAVAP